MEVIHIVLGKANPNRMNGVNKVVYQLATQQTQHGTEVSVWGITKDLENNYGERNFRTKLFRKSLNPFGISNELKQAILEKKDSVTFHIHGGWVPAFSSLCAFMGKHQVAYVYTPHGAYNTIAMKRNWLVKKIYFNWFEKSVLENAKTIHCIGDSEVQGLSDIYETDKTQLLPYGFDTKRDKVPTDNTQEQFIIGFVGRLDIYTKGLDLLLDSFEKFHQMVPNSKLWIIGDSNEKMKLMKMIDNKGIYEHVVLFGGKFGEEKDMLIKRMHLFAHPSRNEGLPASVIEAANFGVPCVVSEATNMAHYITQYKAGVAIQNESAKELQNAFVKIHQLWQNNHLKQIRQNAQSMIQEAFSWDTLIPQFNKLYLSN